MRTLLVIILLIPGFFHAGAQDMKTMNMNTQAAKPAGVSYTCPMHPEIRSSKAGKCPKCGMPLVVDKTKTVARPISKSSAKPVTAGNQSSAVSYTCPMHPEIHSPKPGNCPKCGMKLVKEKTNESPAQPNTMNRTDMSDKKEAAAVESYTCPMHPEIHSPKPGNCPKCGMKLVKEKTNEMQAQPNTINRTDMSDDKKAATAVESYTCPMHPEIHSPKPGNCPKCGMKLVKEEIKTTATDDMPGMDMNESLSDNDMNIAAAKARLGKINYLNAPEKPHTVRYDIYLRDTIVTYGKKPKRAISANGQIPMPTLTFTEGDTAEIWVHNQLKEETSVHWHGLFVPNKEDGVPYLTQYPIKPGSVYVYRFPIVQHGTHWYHSHSKLQEQIGMYGAFIMNKRKEWDIPTIPVVLSEWTDMKPEEVHRSLRAATDWFAIQKGSTQSYAEAIRSGNLKIKLNNEWKRMNAMDVSDVYYDNFLVNGKNQNEQPQFKAGDKVRLRICNAGASDYFWLNYAGGKITVVATDGNDVEPIEVDRLIIAVSETYDVVVTIPENKSYEFLITPEDRTKHASMWLGAGEKVAAARMPKLKYFAGMKMMNEMMDMNGNMIEMKGMKMENQIMDMNQVMYPEITGPENPKDTLVAFQNNSMVGMNHSSTDMASMSAMENTATDLVTLNYTMLKAPEKTTLRDGPWKEMHFDLTGNMNRYVWSIDNKVISESDKILIRKGENVRIIMFNNSMMRHPMHLHGQDFRLLNGQGDYSVLKNIIDIMPMERDTIEFAATEPGGDWFFHCHVLYHMMSGMGRVFRYADAPGVPGLPTPSLAARKLNSDDRSFHPMGRIGLESNGTDGEFMLSQTRYRLMTMWHLGIKPMHGYESETMFGRFMGRNQWLYPYVGYDYHYKPEHMQGEERKNIFGNEDKNMFGQRSNKNNRSTVVAGVAYTLPSLFIADMRADADGKFRFQLGREDIPLTKRARFNLMVNTDKEYAAGLRYIITKYISASTHYYSDMGAGIGVTFTY